MLIFMLLKLKTKELMLHPEDRHHGGEDDTTTREP